MSASTSGALVDDHVLEILRKSQVEKFANLFVFHLQVRRFDHFAQIRDKDMINIGLQPEQIKVLRDQIQKMSRELWNRSDPKQVFIALDSTSTSQPANDERAMIPNNQVKLFEKLGEGSFAVVKRGVWMQNETKRIDVAVKILRDASPTVMEDLKIEASHLLKLQHPSLIRLYGYCQQPAMMVFELCEGGSLLDRLRSDDKPVVLVTRLLDYCVQIAKAFQFLESKHRVHRDLAARNILLSKDEQLVKICDFGLMRSLSENQQMYTMSPEKKVPFAWCAPESLKHRKFSHASDVWSYGVLLWELFTYGEEPWTGSRAIEVMKLIESGERLEKPKYCSTKIYQIMQNCWKHSPDQRCKFNTIREDLKAASFLNGVVRESFNTTQPGYLQLAVRDEVIIIENESAEYYGQSKKTHNFGMFPSTNVFVQSNTAATSVPITPQKIPAITPVKVAPTMPTLPKPKMTSKNTEKETGSNRISMPVAVATHPSTSLTLQLDDEFEKAFNGSFSPSAIEYPRGNTTNNTSINSDFGINLSNSSMSNTVFEKHVPQPALIPTRAETVRLPATETIQIIKPKTDINFNQPRHVSSAGSRLDAMVPSFTPTIPKNQSNGHFPQNVADEIRVRIESDMARPRPSSTNGVHEMPNRQPAVLRPTSVFNGATNVPLQPPVQHIPCLVPTPINNVVKPTVQKALNEEMKMNLHRRQTEMNTQMTIRSHSASSQHSVVNHHTSLPPHSSHKLSTQVIPTPIAPLPNAVPTVQIKDRQVQPTAAKVPSPVTVPQVTKTLPTPQQQPIKTDNVVIRKNETVPLSQDERRSKIISQVNDWLPAPSPLLLGTTTPSGSNVTTTAPITTRAPTPTQVKPIQQLPPPPKKYSEPVLPTTVLQPTVLPAARHKSTVDPPVAHRQQPPQQPVKKISAPPVQPQVPLFNITNSSAPPAYPAAYPPVYPNFSNGYSFSNYNSYYNPYANNTMSRPMSMYPAIMPNLVSENQSSASNVAIQPLAESDIAELLGQNRGSVAPPNPVVQKSNSGAMIQKMEQLYKDASFTHAGNCDAMVAKCNGDTDLALKRLKQDKLIEMGVAENAEKARIALESRNYDLAAAANLLLG